MASASLAFAGIAIPDKFFTALERAGVVLVGREAFADHHAFTAADLARLEANARSAGRDLVTTPKDAVRLPPGMSVARDVRGAPRLGEPRRRSKRCSTNSCPDIVDSISPRAQSVA